MLSVNRGADVAEVVRIQSGLNECRHLAPSCLGEGVQQ